MASLRSLLLVKTYGGNWRNPTPAEFRDIQSGRLVPDLMRVSLPRGFTFKRYPDRCYAVVRGRRRGPCGHDKITALARYHRSGLVASARSDSQL